MVWLLLQALLGGYKINPYLQVQRFQQKLEILQIALPKAQVQGLLPPRPLALAALLECSRRWRQAWAEAESRWLPLLLALALLVGSSTALPAAEIRVLSGGAAKALVAPLNL